MTTETAMQASEPPQEAWARWQGEHAALLERSTGPQRVLLEATVRFVAVIAAQPILLRVAAYFLLHAGMGLTLVQVGAAVGRTDRAMHTVRALAPRELLDSIWAELGRHRQPRLHAEHAGPIAKYLVDVEGVKMVVVACNTASSVALEDLRDEAAPARAPEAAR